jgi:chemosensory pili system protein ChpA (sensor histidine kinase/response regulator)
MVVDDSLTVRRLTARLLSRAGYDVSAAKDGADALQQMQRGLPDLLVIDLEMPRMDGFELARILRADGRTAQVPIVVVTSRLAEKHQRRAAEMGADAFFGKPYAEDELLACIAGLLGRRQAAQAAQAA